MLTNDLVSLRASGWAQLSKCDSWVGKGRVNLIRSGLVWHRFGGRSSQKNGKNASFFFVLAALTFFARSQRILLIISPSGGVG
jgi:hypothetical protein